jgi:hypothetical protein
VTAWESALVALILFPSSALVLPRLAAVGVLARSGSESSVKKYE